ncbi:ferredoxin [Blastococcus sp. TF02A_35]|uniref:ferredoxin n=1 Tax=Blastococcus sp. TF02A-35 TaxID=2559612 RepID=UPI001073B603|nr:ferredoxin [Blastococcus sp. TF02A_35]TFV52343.1 ferredoxin [Blastococcus sp. TF02A_35]
MTRIALDGERCVGSGACESLAPDFFEVGDDGMVAVLRAEPGPGEERDVAAAVQQCPTRALALVEEQPAGAAG